MKNRPIFVTVKAYVDEQEYTVAQIENVTPPQVQSLLGLTINMLELFYLITE